MKRRIVYNCSFCGKDFDFEQECREHELDEIGATMEQYHEYVNLHHRKLEAESVLAVKDDEEMVREYEETCKALDRLGERTGVTLDKWKRV